MEHKAKTTNKTINDNQNSNSINVSSILMKATHDVMFKKFRTVKMLPKLSLEAAEN